MCSVFVTQALLCLNILTYKLPEIQTKLSICPVACAAAEDGSKKRRTILKEASVDIIKRFEGGKKIINILHSLGVNCQFFNRCIVGLNTESTYDQALEI
jgi:hypothetical protein